MANNDPFQLHTFERLGEIRQFADWLLQQATLGQPVALALKGRQKKLALSTRDDAWVIDLKNEFGALALDVLKTNLLGGRTLFFLRNAAKDLSELVTFLDTDKTQARLIFDTLATCLVGDLTGSAYVINQNVTKASAFKRIEQDAFEIALIVPQYTYDIPAYYQKVALPTARLQSEMWLFGGGKPEWMIEYTDLWIKVLVYYTQDPTLLKAIYEGEDPRALLSRIFQCTETEAEMYLLLAACGWNAQVLTKRFPDRVKELPENLPEVQTAIGRKLPVLVSNVNAMAASYLSERVATTLYGRRLRPGQSGGEAVAFRIFGTVDDLVGVASATYWTNRIGDDTMIIGIHPLSNSWRILGRGPSQYAEKLAWLNQLKELAPLANPLGTMLPLRPNVIQLP